ncbi:unnamed protein product [Rotaria sordida]|uniref:ARID domain-containing protein n=1 Tax=Rotaria sordida TaxID=392033 RepID=A0A818WCN4_9BILA|nr:unnamed protein product [Rotaria sordida]
MSYESVNNFYSNPNARTQQTMMVNQIRGSTNYGLSTSQPPMTNQYQSYPPHTSHQTFSPYERCESRSSGYYASNTGAYEYQQSSIGPTSYGENHIQSSSYLSKDSNLSSSINDLNSRTRSNDYQNSNTSTPAKQTPQGNFGYNNTSFISTTHPSSKQQQTYFTYLQQQDDMYDSNNTPQYSSGNSAIINSCFSTPNTNTYRSPYQNEMNSTTGKVLSYPQPTHYPSHPNESNNYPSSLQSTCSSNISTSVIDLDSNYAYPYNTHSSMYVQASTNEYHLSSVQDNDNNISKTKQIQYNISKSPSCTSMSSYVPDDIDSSNSSFSDSPSISNEKIYQKRKIHQTTSIEVFNKLREMGNEQERNLFVDRLQKLWEEHHVICRKLPTISRQTIDLYRLYIYVREQNGFEQFSKIAKNRHWRNIASKLNVPNTTTAPFHIKQKYINLKLFHYECKYDHGGIDPDIILAEIDKAQEKHSKTINKKNNKKLTSVQDQLMQSSNQSSSIEQSNIDNLSSQQSRTIVSKNSQSSNLTFTSPISSKNYQLQQVPTLTNQLSKTSEDSSNVTSISKSISFPINSVEATTISSKIKRKKLTMKDISPIDSMKLLMSLRGGLLAGTTWALDTINIMLSDDQTHTYLDLKQMPGLLQAIIDIYIKCLTELFDEFKIDNKEILNDNSRNKYQYKQEHDSVIYRIESNYLNKYQRKYTKQQNIIYEHVYDDCGNLKNNPENILELQNTDELSYIKTHFDPLHKDDNYYENLYYGHHYDDTLSSDEHDQEPIKKSYIPSSHKHITTYEINNIKFHDQNSDLLLNISDDNNKEFLQRYKRKFQSDENSSNIYLTNLNNQEENTSTLFSRYSSGYDQICSRCICISTILRNLSFISGNDIELVNNKTLIHVLARLLLLGHSINHTNKTISLSNEQMKELSNDQIINDYSSKNENQNTSSFSLSECLVNIRENTLVTLTNIASVLIFDTYDSYLINQLINGLLYWSTCYSNEIIDSLQSSYISIQHLSIEILTKLSVHDMNMDFILATPSFYCIISLFHILTNWLNVDNMNNNISNSYINLTRSQAYIQREFAIVLLNALIRCDSNVAHIIAHIPYTISLLINFLEDYEKKTLELITRYGSDYVLNLINNQETEQILFTTNDMLKRAATCLLSMINYTDNIKIMKKYEDRILNLSISNIIDRNIGRILTDILHYCSLYNS